MEITHSTLEGNVLQEFTKDYLEKHKELIEFVKKETIKQLTLTDVISSFLDKESESLGINRNYLYLHLVDDKLYLEKQNDDDYYFGLEDVRIVE
tara:strand:+ start:226 stop:507 length:282 start_codon:yes stop_codon:yes gene_type:complete